MAGGERPECESRARAAVSGAAGYRRFATQLHPAFPKYPQYKAVCHYAESAWCRNRGALGYCYASISVGSDTWPGVRGHDRRSR